MNLELTDRASDARPTKPAVVRTPPDAPSGRTRDAAIDVLRGLSIVLVVLHHVGLRIPLRRGVLADFLPARLLVALTGNGYEAVFVFFVISGFLITSNTLARWGALGAIDIRAFYRRRAARILPCLSLLVAVLAVLDRIGANHFVIDASRQSLARALLAVAGLHLNWYEGMTGYLPANWDVLWSLSIEEVFYLAFPVVCLLPGARRWLLPLAMLFALSLPWSHAALDGNEIWQEKAYLPGMSAIATGVIAALLAQRWRPPPRTATWLGVSGWVGLVAVFGFENLLWRSLKDGCLLVLTMSVAALLVASKASPVRDHRRLSRATRSLRSFGRLSYEVYLTHMFVVWLVVDVYRRIDADEAWGFLWYGPALGLSWALGRAVAHGVSLPVERAIRRRAVQE